MSVEVLLLVLIAGITLLAYMIAINAHGPTRLGLSYLIATVMLAGTVWLIVQHVNNNLDSQKAAELRRLGMEKQLAEKRLKSQQQQLMENKERMAAATKINAIVTRGTNTAVALTNINLQDRTVDLDVLIGRAAIKGKEAREIKDDVERLTVDSEYFSDALSALKEAVQLLNEAAYYYKSYYYSEDADQEELRERILLQKARASRKKFQDVADIMTSIQ